MQRVYVELERGRIVRAWSNCGQVELVILHHEQQSGYRVVAEHMPDLTAKDARAEEE